MTGDLPTPVKYYNERIQQAYREIEGIALSGRFLCCQKS